MWGLLGVAAAAGGVAFSSSAVADARTKELKAAAAASKPAAQAALQQQPKGSDSLPVFTAEEVAQHRTPKDRVWVTYKDGVYDVTDFVAQVRAKELNSWIAVALPFCLTESLHICVAAVPCISACSARSCACAGWR